ncbi:molybdopterin-binding protein [Pectinatus brassicae]|uniref:Molybdopterin molybdenumtransferase n=1 Tax=Pectinatus brassicae TaxID=862415 RepID=A0A840UMY0_9FIRM|nr:molybdopterin-binding protein [Pectinatus brassicae]MBB5335602.1 molybdopterin molybdotransferase/putative molybdopterin biosynthesis protein [Pectinatus brassicae]
MEYRKYVEKGLMPSRQAMKKLLRDRVSFKFQVEEVELMEALNRIAAEDIATRRMLPNLPVGKMDGIGVRAKDFETGMPDTYLWENGREYVFVNTGCSITAPYDTLILIEDIDFIEGHLVIKKTPEPGQLVDPPGSSINDAEIILHKYQQITPAAMGILAAGGVKRVAVIKKPKVVFIPTGDELAQWSIDNLPAGTNIESNGMMIYAFLKQYQADPVIFPIVRDNKEALYDALQQAAQQADLILINAGSSKGTKDYTLDILENKGQVVVYELGCRPGKHSSFSFFAGKPVLGMAGPPNGAELAARFYVKTLLDNYYHQAEQEAIIVEAVAEFSFKAPDNYDFCIQAHVYCKENSYYVQRINPKAVTRPQLLEKCNAYIYLPVSKEVHLGDKLTAELIVGKEVLGTE